MFTRVGKGYDVAIYTSLLSVGTSKDLFSANHLTPLSVSRHRLRFNAMQAKATAILNQNNDDPNCQRGATLPILGLEEIRPSLGR